MIIPRRLLIMCGLLFAIVIHPSGQQICFAQIPEQPKTEEKKKDAAASHEGKATIDPEQATDAGLDAYQKGDIEKATALFNQVMSSKPTLPKLQLLQGLLLMYHNQGNEALVHLDDYNKNFKNDYRGFAAVGTIYLNSKMNKMAVYPLLKAQEFAPQEVNGKPVRAQIAMDLAMAYINQNLKKKAVEQAKSAASFAPNDAELQMKLAQIAAQSDDLNVSLEAVMRALVLFDEKRRDDPFNLDVTVNMKKCFGVLSSLHNFKINSDPKNGDNYFEFAKMQLKAAELDHATSLINARTLALQAIEKNPDKIEYALMVVQLEYQLGALHDAKERLVEILRKNPQNKEALDLQQRLFGGTTTAPAK